MANEKENELALDHAKELAHKELAKLSSEKKIELAREQKKEIAHEEKPLLKEESYKDLESALVRLQAEFENYRKRTQKELAERADLGKMEFALSQISFLDEFEHSLSHLEGDSKIGMLMLLSNFKKSLEAQGVREMDALGKKFDPYLHEAVMQQESEKPEGTILAVAKKGYYFKDKVLRHAQVIVAKKAEEKAGSGSADQEGRKA